MHTAVTFPYTVMHDTSSITRSSPSRCRVPPRDAAVVVRSTTTTRDGLTTQASAGASRCLNSDTPTPDKARGRSPLLFSLLFSLVRSRALPPHETSKRHKTTRRDGPTTRATSGAPGSAPPRRERAARGRSPLFMSLLPLIRSRALAPHETSKPHETT